MKLPHYRLVLLAGMIAIAAAKSLISPFIAGTVFIQLGIIVLVSAAGFACGWLTSSHADKYRAWVFVAIILLLSVVALGDFTPLGASYTTTAAALGFWIAFAYWLAPAVKKFIRAFREKPTTFGSAEWATLPYLEQNKLIGTDGFRLGQFYGPGNAPIHYTGDRHITIVAPTRAGKGTSFIVPALLTHAGSALVVDPKGENAMITADHRATFNDVHILDPWGIATESGASRFNPLDWLDPADPDMTENAMLLADALVVPDGSGDKFWVEEAKALLQGFLLYVVTSPYEEGNRTLPRVRDLLMLDADDLKALFERMLDSKHLLVRSTGARSLQKDEKLLASVIASAQSQTAFLDSTRLRASMAVSDFRFEDLKTSPMTVYLVLPADRLDTFNRWLRLMIQQAVTISARNIAYKPDKPILFLLDELTSLSRLSSVEQAYSLMAGFGMIMCGIIQDLGRLKKVYGEGSYESFIANSGAIVYMGSRDKMTSEYFSSLCGVTTVWNVSSALAHAVSATTGKASSTSVSDTDTETTAAVERKLAFPDELMRLKADCQLVFIENHNPIRARKVLWYADPTLRHLGRNLHQQ